MATAKVKTEEKRRTGGFKPKNKEKEKRRLLRLTLEYIFCALFSFLAAGVRVEGEIYPFGAVFSAGAAPKYLLPCALGSALGSLLFLSPIVAVKNIGAALLIYVFRQAHFRLAGGKNRQLFLPVIAFFAVFTSAGIVSLTDHPGASSLLINLAEGVLAAAGTCFSMRAFLITEGQIKPVFSSPADSVALLLTAGVLLSSLMRLKIGSVSPAFVVGETGLILLSYCVRAGAGAGAGAVTGAVLGFSGENVFLAFSQPLSGLICSALAPYGKLPVAAAFSLIHFIFVFLRGDRDNLLLPLSEGLLSALLFLLIPQKALDRISGVLRPFSETRYDLNARRILSLQLRRVSGAVKDVSDGVRAVSRMEAKKESCGAENIAAEIKKELCKTCLKQDFCSGRTDRALLTAAETALKKGRISEETLPETLSVYCRNKAALIDALEEKYRKSRLRTASKNEVLDVKLSAAASFGSLADILEESRLLLEGTGRPDPYLASLAEDVFTDAGFSFSFLTFAKRADGTAVMEVFCTRIPADADPSALLEKLRLKTGVRFSPPEKEVYEKEGTVLSFCQAPPLRAQFYRMSREAESESVCGDTARCFFDGRGSFFCVLSDGMGTGQSAALDSVMTCGLMSRLLKAGFSADTALKSVNAALLVKNTEESLATLDIFQLDLYTGCARFMKAGGTYSIVKKDMKTVVIEKSSLPLGIMSETAFETSQITLSAADAVILISDGADRIRKSFYKDLFYAHKNADAKELCELIMREAVRVSPLGRRDDITVVCVKITQS